MEEIEPIDFWTAVSSVGGLLGVAALTINFLALIYLMLYPVRHSIIIFCLTLFFGIVCTLLSLNFIAGSQIHYETYFNTWIIGIHYLTLFYFFTTSLVLFRLYLTSIFIINRR